MDNEVISSSTLIKVVCNLLKLYDGERNLILLVSSIIYLPHTTQDLTKHHQLRH